jgi:hypothetical protein
MISQKTLFYINFFVVVQLFLFTCLGAQSLKPYIGIHGGINLSQPIVIGTNQQIVTLLNGDDPQKRKYTGLFKSSGYQVGFSLYLKIKDKLSIGFLPEISKYTYGYQSQMIFYNNLGDSVLNVENLSKSKIEYFNLPLILQYQLNIQKASPYIFIGASYGLLRSAQHTVKVNSVQENGVEFNESSTDNYSSEYIRSKINLLGGIGVIRDFKLFHLAIDLSYWIGMNNIINESNRYNTHSIGGTTYDIPDDIKLNHIVLNTSVIFPINKSNNRGSLDCIVQKKKK